MDKKILIVINQWGYGDKERGVSLEKEVFETTLRKIFKNAYSYYYDQKDLIELNYEIVKIYDKIKPDIIFFATIKDEFSFETLRWLKNKCITINWFSDDQWRIAYSKDYAKEFTYALTTDHWTSKREKNAILVPWGSNHFIPPTQKYKYDVTFVGAKSKERENIINYLKYSKIHVECFGAGWKNGTVSYEKMREIFNTSKINLNLSNSNNHWILAAMLNLIHTNNITDKLFGWLYLLYCNIMPGRDKFNPEFHDVITFFRARANIKSKEQIKARHFEIPACGGFQISFYHKDVGRYFEPGKEIAFYHSKESLKEKIKHYLIVESIRENEAENAFKKAKENYAWETIFRNALTFLE